MAPRSKVVLLGPQRLHPTLNLAVDALGVHGRIAAITAGWEEREGEDQELSAHLGGRTINLRLWERAADVSARDPELLRGWRARIDAQREIHEIYKLRLGHEMECARELLRREMQDPTRELVLAECEGAIEAVRQLDAFHLKRTRAVHDEFMELWRPHERESVARHRREIAAILREVECLCVAGGHVARLVDHLRLFGIFGLMPEMPVVAWSAGSMALAERIVLFHDSPPQGPGNAEVFEVGIGLYHGVIPLPHAAKRLKLDDPLRVRLMARRFRPAFCAVLDPKTRLDWNGRRWRGETGTLRLCEDGKLAEVNAA
ncbi:MAG: hypothetical protein IPJ77_14290 [Planctomycetes bacterium]|nr:hypothetical protein [Planctomycetota bacterium]